MSILIEPKFVFVTGGVSSSLGKGLTASSLGRLLKERGFRVTMIKLDPYINIDPGTMNPFEHGEVFVTDDGGETDLDLGHYERFLDETLTKASNATTGVIYSTVIAKERRGDYLGKTVQVIPHVTDEIKRRIMVLADQDVDFVICEVGGTVGDIEIVPFLEAIRQFKQDVGRDRVCYVHTSLVPYLPTSQEHKTKPTQHSVTELRSRGIQPDVIVCRSTHAISRDLKKKISLLCDVEIDAVVSAIDAEIIYEIPLNLREEGLDRVVLKVLGVEATEGTIDVGNWSKIVEGAKNARHSCDVAIIGKYVKLPDAYLSVVEALKHAGYALDTNVAIRWVESELFEGNYSNSIFEDLDGVVIPGGFGERGVEGKIEAVRFCREHDIPMLGICLGLQIMVIEFARNVAKLEGANSQEFDPNTPFPVIALLKEQEAIEDLGGSMRLGKYFAKLHKGSKVFELYNTEIIDERHRHRYEVNPKFVKDLEEAGLFLCGKSLDEKLVEFIELPNHPYFVGTQAHPEFKSRPDRAHPLFFGLVKNALIRRELRQGKLLEIDN